MEKKVYAQVYSLIKVSRDGFIDAIKKLSEIGYDGIEAIGAHTGGLEKGEFKSLIKDLNLDIISYHGLAGEADFEFAREMGARFTDLRLDHNAITREQLLREADKLNQEGKIRAKYGLKAVLHNHAEEFRWVEGEENKTRIYDLLLENTDPELVGFEFDVGWGKRGAINPEDYIIKYAGRFPLLHVKECSRAATNYEEMEHFPTRILKMGAPKIVEGAPKFTDEQMRLMYESRNWNVELGKGLINWTALRDAAEAQGVQAYINEREYHHIGDADGDPVRCAELDYQFLRAL